MKILAFGASSSRQSINKQLATYAASLVANAKVEVLDLNDYEMPIYSADREAEGGIPERVQAFLAKLGAADAIIISFAEHNGSYSAAYKNIYDWCSRAEKKVFQGKPAVWLATSPGPHGASNVLATAVMSALYFGADLRASLSIPSFYQNFDGATGQLTNADLQAQLAEAIGRLS